MFVTLSAKTLLKNFGSELLVVQQKFGLTENFVPENYDEGVFLFLTATWLPHGQLSATVEGAASLTQC